MSEASSNVDKQSDGKLIIFSLVLSRLNMTPPRNIAGLLLIDIAITFGSTVGVMGQMRTLSSVMALMFALLMGVLSVRFNHKSLLITGLVLYCISALGCFSSQSYRSMLLLYSISGIGLAMVSPMAFALVGELLPLEKRSNATGWIFAGSALSSLVGAPIIGYLASIGGWRMVFVWFVLPISLISLIVAIIGIPSTSKRSNRLLSVRDYFGGFKEVFSNRSAMACLIGTTLSLASYQVLLTYGMSFYRQRFSMPSEQTSILFSALASCYIFGSLLSGRLVNEVGRKPLTILGYVFLGTFTVLLTNMPNLWASMILALLCLIFVGVGDSASNSLTLEQVPEFRGTMMSTYSAATSLGAALGAGIGGMLLVLFDYSILGLVLGILGVMSAITYYSLSEDPTRTNARI